MRIKTNTLKSVRDFFDDELKPFYPCDEIRFYFYWCCESFLNLSKTQVIANIEFRISESMMLKFNFAVKDLKAQKPIQYILGTCDFYGLKLLVTPDVLIPRPETEELVQQIASEHKNFNGRILDICTGSGCIALALKKQFSKSNSQGLDISQKAISVAQENAKRNQLDVDFFVADIFNYGKDMPNQQFDLIVSNPPYVLNSEKSQMQANVLDYEPHQALFVEDDNPLLFYKTIIDLAKHHLNPNGALYLEINESFGNEITEILILNAFSNVQTHSDFRGKSRFISATL
ncbi:MAG: peptide chain release factor N(5)-glutamine methyltransferase [Bacteroidales bacterium]|nr:peptide chain release factor N(5)-glutamine methyltransferase [Bacteroidales bacterium]